MTRLNWEEMDEGPHTSVPNRLLALLVGLDHCEHAADDCCYDCTTKAMEHGLSLLESSAAARSVPEDGREAELWWACTCGGHHDGKPRRALGHAPLRAAAPVGPEDGGEALRREVERREDWLEGYEWALTYLTDPGVLADARGLAMQREQAETAREAPGPLSPDEPRGNQAARTVPAAPSPLLAEQDAVHADLVDILHALGIGAHARPYSSHEVVQREVLPAIRAIRAHEPNRESAAAAAVRERRDDAPDGFCTCDGPGSEVAGTCGLRAHRASVAAPVGGRSQEGPLPGRSVDTSGLPVGAPGYWPPIESLATAPDTVESLRRERDELALRCHRQYVRIAQCQELHLSGHLPAVPVGEVRDGG